MKGGKVGKRGGRKWWTGRKVEGGSGGKEGRLAREEGGSVGQEGATTLPRCKPATHDRQPSLGRVGGGFGPIFQEKRFWAAALGQTF